MIPSDFREISSTFPILAQTKPGNGHPGMGMDLRRHPGIPTVPGCHTRERETMPLARIPPLVFGADFLKLADLAQNWVRPPPAAGKNWVFQVQK